MYNKEEEMKNWTRAGYLTASFHSAKSKKVYYAVLKDRVLEFYKTQKDERNRKEPRFISDLSTVFNVHKHYDTLLKECISLMLPDETILLRAESSLEENNGWWIDLLDKSRQARATFLGRPVFRDEYFEVAWDIEVVKLPKLKKKLRSEEKVDDLTTKNNVLIGKKRLCVFSHSMLIVKKGLSVITAAGSTLAPLQNNEYMEFPMSAISNFGRQEKFFFFRVGRCAPTGAGELWCATESGEYASSIYEKIGTLCERESEKRRSQGNRIMSISARPVRSQGHRERSFTSSHRSQEAHISQCNSRKISSISSTLGANLASPPSLSSLEVLQALNSRSNSVGSNLSFGRGLNSNIIKEISEKTISNTSCIRNKILSVDQSKKEPIDEQDESSGGTIMFIGDREDLSRKLDSSVCFSNGNRSFEDATNSDASDAISSEKTRQISLSNYMAKFGKKMENLATEEYTKMECGPSLNHPQPDQNFNLMEVRSYVSDSTDSCHSGAFQNRSTIDNICDGHRAYSLGSRPLASCLPSLQTDCVKEKDDLIDERLEDSRMRAHSLGSRSWLKTLKKPGLRTVYNDCFDPLDARKRSDSFSSSNGIVPDVRCTSFSSAKEMMNRSCKLHLLDKNNANDLTEWDFGVLPTGRSGSSSLASVDSSNNSRANSFGVSGSLLLRNAVEEVRKNRLEKAEKHIVDRLRAECLSDKGMLDAQFIEYDKNDDYVKLSPSFNEKCSSENDLKSLLGTPSGERTIDTIHENLVSDDSSRSQSPVKTLERLSNVKTQISFLNGVEKGIGTKSNSEMKFELSAHTYEEASIAQNPPDSSISKNSNETASGLEYAFLDVEMKKTKAENPERLSKYFCDYAVIDSNVHNIQ